MPDISPETMDWTPGLVKLQADGAQPTLCLVIDGDGIYRGMFRRSDVTLQFSEAQPSYPRKERHWKDAVPLWPAFPPWMRLQVTDALDLHAVF